ncbi:MAG: dockerin type I repeat-containing protein, partial [Bacteroidales bacterium]|nr:dockerin type I repeat-containing protein [Candidatus Sodaliphilus fimicaballi]
EGVLLTGVDSNTMYKLQRPAGNPAAMGSSNLLKGITGANVNVYSANVGYYFNATKKKFVRPTATCIMGCGNGYLEVPYSFVGTSTQDVDVDIFFNGIKGDVNGDGGVDIADVNAVIDMILSLQTKTSVADVNGDGLVDVADMNAIIDIILNN